MKNLICTIDAISDRLHVTEFYLITPRLSVSFTVRKTNTCAEIQALHFRHMEKNTIKKTRDSGMIGVAPCRYFRRGR